MSSESYTNLWVQKYEFGVTASLNRKPIKKNGDTKRKVFSSFTTLKGSLNGFRKIFKNEIQSTKRKLTNLFKNCAKD